MFTRPFALALFFAAGLVLAGACADSDVVLEVERPPVLLGASEFELDGGTATFFGEACLQSGEVLLRAERIVFDRDSGALTAYQISGTYAGWSLRAPLLRGQGGALVLIDAVFEQGDAVLRASRVLFEDGEAMLTNINARTSRYRFYAERGLVTNGGLRVQKVRATPCKCGRALELDAERATFRFERGELLLEKSAFRVYGAALARPRRLLLELDEPLDLRFPLRLGYGAGWTFGVEGLPLPAPDESFGRWRTRLTLLVEGLGGAPVTGKTEALRFALTHVSEGRSFRFGLRPARTWDGASWRARLEPDVRLRDGPLDFRLGWSPGLQRTVASLTLTRTFAPPPLRLRPFLRIANESQTGVTAGVDGRIAVLERRAGAWRAGLRLPFLLALYPEAAPYAWGGVRGELAYADRLRVGAGYFEAYGMPRFGYEARGVRKLFTFKAGRPAWISLGFREEARYDFGAGHLSRYDRSYAVELGYAERGGSLTGSWRLGVRRLPAGQVVGVSERWLLAGKRGDSGLELAWWRGWGKDWIPGYSELRLAYAPAPPECAGGWTLAPSLGWDLWRGRVSRAGIELTLNDCCFAWKLGYNGVFVPQLPGEAAGHRVRFGVRLR